MELDYKLTCRTCLASEAEFYKLDAPMMTDADDEEQKTSLIECLRFCTRLPDVPEFPIYICTECSSALQVAYNFVRNALQAHEVLCQKLCPDAQQHLPYRTTDTGVCAFSTGTREKTMRFRCKVCGEKVESKKSLKEHVKLHLDIISYSCQMCAYESKKRSQLSEHYQRIHDMQPGRELLKAKTLMPPSKCHSSTVEELEDYQTDEISLQMEALHNAPTVDLQQQTQQQQHAIELQLQVEPQQQLQQEQHEMSGVFSTDANNISAFSAEFSGMPHELSKEMSIGNEFIVMADGTVEEVMGNGVVIEYINAAEDDGVSLEQNDLVLNDVVSMDVDDMIIEENVTTELVQGSSHKPILPASHTMPPKNVSTITSAIRDKKINCKICANNFSTQDKLKTHMLTHNEIPHFFCDRCPFYTFFKVDLMQHYKMQHNLEPTHKQLQPKNKVGPYGASSSNHSKAYSEVVRSSGGVGGVGSGGRGVESGGGGVGSVGGGVLGVGGRVEGDRDEGGGGRRVSKRYTYNCDLCLYETNAKVNLRRHYLSRHQQNATDVQLRPTIEEIDGTDEECPSTEDSKKNFDDVRNIKLAGADYPHGMNCRKCNRTFYWRNKLKEHYKRHKFFDGKTEVDSISATYNDEMPTTTNASHNTTATTTTTTHSVPLDAMPQVVEIDDIIEDTEIDFEFNQDGLFDDFDEDNEDNENNEDVQDLLLTSDDDFEDLLEEQSENAATERRPYCIHCNKKFFSQYQFENHMFVHRGLAPYRCEMCTNLYNTKRALIRHYKAVHKCIPTRDMIQAKGDKVAVDKTPVEHLNLEHQKPPTLMCAKCPYESTELNNIQIHLKTSHGIQNENFILHKLAFECPRCIRSYETKERLIRHLERSHSVATIIQQSQSSSAVRSVAMSTVDAAAAPTITNAAPAASCGATIAELTQNASTSNSSNNNNNDDDDNYNHHNNDNDGKNGNTQIITTVCTIAQLAAVAEINLAVTCITKTDAGELHYQCNACEFNCQTLLELDEHSKQHPNDETRDTLNFMCCICKCKYKTLLLLKYHMKRHTGRKYACGDCPKTFINRRELDHHQLSHTGEMPFKCDACVKRFRYSHHLKRHRDVQHLGKRQLCTVPGCGRKFTTLSQLKIHTWNHNGNVPYRCKYCDREFKKRELLRQHARKVHQVTLTEEEIAEIYRNTVGYTNPHDFTVHVTNGKMLRRSDAEAEAELEKIPINCVETEMS